MLLHKLYLRINKNGVSLGFFPYKKTRIQMVLKVWMNHISDQAHGRTMSMGPYDSLVWKHTVSVCCRRGSIGFHMYGDFPPQKQCTCHAFLSGSHGIPLYEIFDIWKYGRGSLWESFCMKPLYVCTIEEAINLVSVVVSMIPSHYTVSS